MNKIFLKKRTKVFFGFLAVILMFGAVSFVKAAFEGEGLTVSPPIKEYTVEPGNTVEQTIRLTNPTQNLIEVYPRAMNFGAKGDGGEPVFYEKEDSDTKFSLANWLLFSQSKVALTPEQVVEFKYKIKVPEDAEPGGHYGVVFFATEPPKENKDTSQVAIGSMIGSLVLVKVPGQIIEKGIVEEFGADRKLYFNNKVNLTTRLSNFGNIHFKPKGNIEISNFSGGKADSIKFNEEGGNVLPDSVRKFSNEWNENKILIGRYTAELAITYGENEKPLTAKFVFWVIPWWLIIIVVLILVALIVFFVRKKRKGNGGSRGKKNVPPPPPPPAPVSPSTPTHASGGRVLDLSNKDAQANNKIRRL